MKKRIVKKYHLKDEVKGLLILAFIGVCIITTLFYQAGKVENEKQEKKVEENVIVNFIR